MERCTSTTLAVRGPFDADGVLAFLAARAVPGVEAVDGRAYARAIRLPGGPGVARMTIEPGGVAVELALADPADEPAALDRCRRLLGLGVDPQAANEVLGADPVLAPLVGRRPGLRVVVHPSVEEVAIRAVIGQQVSVAGARTIAGRLAAAHGEALTGAPWSVDRAFPRAAALAEAELPMPRSRARALVALAGLGLDEDELTTEALTDRLTAVPGIGPWTASYVALRGLGDPDAFLASDLGVRHALTALGLDGSPRAAQQRAERWRPYRAVAVHHLWASLG